MISIVPQALTQKKFAPYGLVSGLTAAGSLLIEGAFEATENAQRPMLQIVKITSVHEPVVIKQLEAHPFSAQTFLPLDMAPSLIVVCDLSEAEVPDVATLKAFIALPDQIVTYHRGVLHHKITPLAPSSTFAMTMRQTGSGDDTMLYALAEPVSVNLVV
ncbi:ureidoglycolate lyase [Agrobacterium rosae]|uniref:Ureidoglycolate hydrolase n=1 Tax=Agrobacterium rosae TaxID=1972867 RepID=A0A8I1J517_9HYPH|nr:ureidoglycolate lyase [Agrobacterium rosae]KAA3509587.1 ureidoglycolate hydrolase [Agrobacterium rosae]KAA3516488.1 ureidoglycolate hydrolase [Agrobacterium rosae]MBN7806398.1 ureidoglycolate lyase [Agrobacterium rosae]MBN7806659.1 ureidoglycolate lyase [Agrobacterium rosae]MCM2435003.1 ureidoglycolate hydrolase [Agrobacterium rosae]